MFKFVVSALIFCLFLNDAKAEFECFATVSYKWRKKPQEKAASEKVPEGAAPAADQVVDLARISGDGADESAAKSKLNQLLPEARTKASEACKKSHESKAECLAAKYSSMSSTLNTLRFDSRKSLEDAIANDCEAQSGACLDVAVSEIQCAEKVVPGAASPTVAGAAGKGSKK